MIRLFWNINLVGIMIKNISNNDVADVTTNKNNRLLELRRKERKILGSAAKEELQILSIVKPNWDDVTTPFDFDSSFIQTHYGVRGSGVNVFVLDTGLDTLKDNSNLVAKSFVSGLSPKDESGHGTWIAGRVVDIAPSCNLRPIRVLDGSGTGKSEFTTKALEWILKQSEFPHIVHISYGGSKHNPTHEKLIWQLYRKGSVILVAKDETKPFPSSYAGVNSIDVVDKKRTLCEALDYGSNMLVGLKGVSIRSTYLLDTFKGLTGSVAASSSVAGILALGLSYALRKGHSPSEELRDIILSCLDNVVTLNGKTFFSMLDQKL